MTLQDMGGANSKVAYMGRMHGQSLTVSTDKKQIQRAHFGQRGTAQTSYEVHSLTGLRIAQIAERFNSKLELPTQYCKFQQPIDA